jgi:hypothetical protein
MSTFFFRSLPFALLVTAPWSQAAPTVSSLFPAAGASVTGITSVSVTFNEPVVGVEATDLEINGQAALSVSGANGGPYVFSFTQPGPGTIAVGWDPDHGIAGLGTGVFAPQGVEAAWAYTLSDTVAPGLTVLSTGIAGQEMLDVFPTPNSRVRNLTKVTLQFDEPVTGVDAADLLVNGTAATALDVTAEGVYQFTVTEPAEGPVAITWAAGHGIADGAGNAFAGTGWNATRVAAHGTMVITEFLAANGGFFSSPALGIRDENFDLSPWIELTNSGTTSVDLTGWSLTDDVTQPRQWVFPSRTLAAGGRLILWASGKNRKPTAATGHLHTNFELGVTSGGYLGLFTPDGAAEPVASQFLNYPQQRFDHSYGRQGSDGQPRYFTPPSISQTGYALPSTGTPSPTPPSLPNGVANPSTSALTALLPEPTANVTRGYFTEPFTVLLSSSIPGATIRYTLDGSLPTLSSTAYTAPIVITRTSSLRFTAFATGSVPSRAVTHTYLFLDGVVNQPSPPYYTAATPANPQPPSVGPTALPIHWGTNTTVNFTAGNTLGGASNLPAAAIPADYGMDPKVYGDPNRYNDNGDVDPAGKTNAERISKALREMPMLCVTTSINDMWGSGGLYPSSIATNKADNTKYSSMEFINPDGSTQFQIDCGIDIHGNASRDPFKNPKHGFTIRFKSRYGDGKLRTNLFPDSPAREWDKLVLRGDFNSSWLHQNGNPGITAGSDNHQRPRGIRIRDAWCKDSFRDMGRMAGHHRYVNLFLNGVFWGSYELAEDQSEDFATNYFGGKGEDYDIIDQLVLKSGTWTKYWALKGLLGWTGATFGTVPTAATFNTAFTNAQYEQAKEFVDVPWFIDYMLLHLYTGHRDWATVNDYAKNFYTIRYKDGKFKYLPWDQENLLWAETEDRVTGMTNYATGASPTLFPPTAIHPRLKSNAEYRLDFADRVWAACIAPDGALTPAANIARLNKWASLMNADQMCLESARWGDYRYKVHSYTVGTFNEVYSWNGKWYENGTLRTNTAGTNAWNAEISRLKNTYFPARTTNLLAQLRTNGLYPTLNAPVVLDAANQAPVNSRTLQVRPNHAVILGLQPNPIAGTTSAGTLYYTTDGSDPRVPYSGAVGATAQAYTLPGVIFIPQTTTLKARALNGTVWSALAEVKFTVGRQLPSIAISEIHYRPRSASSHEFLEIHNYGTQPVDMSNWSMDGVDFIFPMQLVLPPNGRIVLASNDNPAGFAATYPGVVVTGYFSGSLSNDGERLSVLNATGAVVTTVEYGDSGAWPAAADGGGPSLELTSLGHRDLQNPANWTATAVVGTRGGTPGTAPAASTAPPARISRVSGTSVQVLNTSNGPLNTSGLNLQILTSGTAVVVSVPTTILDVGQSADVSLPTVTNHINGIQLRQGTTAVWDGIRLGAQVPNHSFNVMSNRTFNFVNASTDDNPTATLADVKLNEVLANPATGLSDWLELANTHASEAVDVTGLEIVINGAHTVVLPPTAIAAGGFLRIYCDPESQRSDSLPVRLPSGGASIVLTDPQGTVLDTLTYGPQSEGISSGRLPDATGALTSLSFASPAATNTPAPSNGPKLNEVLPLNNTGELSPWAERAPWLEIRNTGLAINLQGYRIQVLTTSDTLPTAVLPNVALPADGYVRVWSTAQSPAAVTASGKVNLGLPLRSASGIRLLSPQGQVCDELRWGRLLPDRSLGRDNSGVWQLLSALTPSAPNAPGQPMGGIGGVRINEWSSGELLTNGEFLELHNPSALPVNIAGLWLGDSPAERGRRRWQFPPHTYLAPASQTSFAPQTSGYQPAQYGFRISSGGEFLRLSDNSAGNLEIDSLAFGGQPANRTQGRIPNGSGAALTMAPTPGASNQAVSLPSQVPVFLTHPQSVSAYLGQDVALRAFAQAEVTEWQWTRNGILLPDATEPVLLLSAVNHQEASGIYQCVARNATGSTTSLPATVEVLADYARFAAFNQLGTATQDADNDGVSNSIEFLTGTDPLAPSPQTLVPGLDNNSLTLTLPLSPGITYDNLCGQLSSQLESWEERAPNVWQNLPTLPDGRNQVMLKFDLPAGEPRKFLRLKFIP